MRDKGKANNMASFKKVYELQSGGYPLNQVLVVLVDDEPVVRAFFADDEMDVFAVDYDDAGVIIFHVDDFEYLSINTQQLLRIVELATEAAALSNELRSHWDDEKETWVGHEHLITHPNDVDAPK